MDEENDTDFQELFDKVKQKTRLLVEYNLILGSKPVRLEYIDFLDSFIDLNMDLFRYIKSKLPDYTVLNILFLKKIKISEIDEYYLDELPDPEEYSEILNYEVLNELGKFIQNPSDDLSIIYKMLIISREKNELLKEIICDIFKNFPQSFYSLAAQLIYLKIIKKQEICPDNECHLFFQKIYSKHSDKLEDVFYMNHNNDFHVLGKCNRFTMSDYLSIFQNVPNEKFNSFFNVLNIEILDADNFNKPAVFHK